MAGRRAQKHEQLRACVGAEELTLWVSLSELVSGEGRVEDG